MDKGGMISALVFSFMPVYNYTNRAKEACYMKKSWWKVPVYCMAASWVCFQMEVHFLGKWTIVTLPDGSLSSDNARWLILSAILFLAVVCMADFSFFAA